MGLRDLHFSLLGPFQVWRGETRLDGVLRGRLPGELLAFLVLERARLVPSERLLEALWPDLDPHAAANNLQGVVWKLRRGLEPGLRRGRDSHYIVTERGGYRFVADACQVDLDDFAHAVQAGQAALRSDDLAMARAALERARELYRGPLLADLPYAEWAFPAREQLREVHLEALEALGETCLRLGARNETLAVAQEARTIDPFRESFVRQQMRARAALGERAEALEASDELARLLDEERGLEPSEETRALRQAILTDTLEQPMAEGSGLLDAAIELPLVGRDDVLERFAQAREVGTGIVLLSGEAGIGKTRLLAELVETVGERVLASRAQDGDPLFASVLRLVEQHLRTEPPIAELETLGPLGAALSQRIPALRELMPDCPPYAPLDTDAEEQRLRQAVLAGLELAAQSASAIVVDDLHWADAGSLAVFADLPTTRLLLAGAYRVDEPSPALADVLSALRAREQPPLEIELHPLSAADVVAAVRAVSGLDDPLPLSRRLHELTGGNPLFLTETLRGLREEGHVYRDPDGVWHTTAELDDLPLTATLRDAIRARAGMLDPLVREVLDAAAVLAPSCTTELLETMLQIDADRLEAALESLAAGRWLQPVEPDGWEPTHHLIAEAVVAELAPVHRRLLHRLAAEALAVVIPAEPVPAAVDVVRHLEEGGGAPEPLARWAVLAGEWAAEHLSYRRAEAYFELAEAQLELLAEGAERRRLALAALQGLGRVRQPLGESAAAFVALEHAPAFAETPTERARLLVGQARICQANTAEYGRALKLLDEAERLVQESPERDTDLLLEILIERADTHYWRGEYAPGERLARQALARAEGTTWETQALRTLGNHLQSLGRLQETVDVMRRMRQITETGGDVRGSAFAGIPLSNSLFALGRLVEARVELERSREIVERLGDLRKLSIIDTNSGIIATGLGDLADAESHLRRAVALAEQVDAPYTVAVARHSLGDALTQRGRLAEAGAELAAAIAVARDIDARVIEAQARVHLGRWQLARGDPEGATAEAELAVVTGDAVGDNFCRREGRLLLGQVAYENGDLKRAEEHAREALRLAGEAQQARAVAGAERLLGQVATARSALDDATAHLVRSEEILRRMGALVALGETLLARAEAAAGHEDARAFLVEARRLFRRCRARPLLKRAERLLAGNRNSAPAKNGRRHSIVDEQRSQ